MCSAGGYFYSIIYLCHSQQISNFTMHLFHFISQNRATPPDHRMEAVICQHLTDDVYFPVWLCMYMFGSISCSDKTPESAVSFQPTSSPTKMVLPLFWTRSSPLHLQCIYRNIFLCWPCFSLQGLEEKLIPVTIFWIFSSFFSMLDLTAQILSCWSLISCSSSVSSALRGSTARSVALQHTQENKKRIARREKKNIAIAVRKCSHMTKSCDKKCHNMWNDITISSIYAI